jgi:hypothetical protein
VDVLVALVALEQLLTLTLLAVVAVVLDMVQISAGQIILAILDATVAVDQLHRTIVQLMELVVAVELALTVKDQTELADVQTTVMVTDQAVAADQAELADILASHGLTVKDTATIVVETTVAAVAAVAHHTVVDTAAVVQSVFYGLDQLEAGHQLELVALNFITKRRIFNALYVCRSKWRPYRSSINTIKRRRLAWDTDYYPRAFKRT